MIVQVYPHKLRLIEQHQHALLCSALAQAWRTSNGLGRLDFVTLLAAGLHDLPWVEPDRDPLWNPESGWFHDFISYPMQERAALYTRGIDALESLEPHVALLTSRHYLGLLGKKAPEHFKYYEKSRQERLLKASDTFYEDRVLEHALKWLRFLDAFSLFLCMTPPGVESTDRPPWLSPDVFAFAPDRIDLPPLNLTWRNANEVCMEPFVLDAPFSFRIPVADMARGPWSCAREAQEAWRARTFQISTIRIAPKVDPAV